MVLLALLGLVFIGGKLLAALLRWGFRRKRSLVDMLSGDIRTGATDGPDWPTVVEDAVLRQDTEWLYEAEEKTLEIKSESF